MPRFRALRGLAAFPLALVLATAVSTPTSAAPVPPDSSVRVVVLREHGAGSAAAAQSYLDQFMSVVSKVNAWTVGEGRYHTDRARAEAYIAETKPQFGLLSLGAFLALDQSHKLEPLGKAILAGGGGEQFYLISKRVQDPSECRGQTLATTFGDDVTFVNKIVFGGTWSLSDFTVQPLKRPLQPLKAVISGEATCALVDDAQLAELGHMPDAEGVKPVWFSAKLPALVIVAFPSAGSPAIKQFKASLTKVCDGDGASACKAVGVKALVPLDAKDFASSKKDYRR